MSSTHPPQYSYSQPPPRLPSIKDLNFPPPGQGQDGPPMNGSGRPEHGRPRHDPASWGRPAPPQAHSGPPQHSPNMPPPHEQPPKSHPHAYPPPHKPDASYAQQAPPPPQPHPHSLPPHSTVGAGPPRPENTAEASSKRARSSQSGVSASPAHSPHTAYPPYPQQQQQQHQPPSYHQVPPQAAPPPQEHAPQHPHFSHPPPPGYAPYPPPTVAASRHYATMPPPPPPHHAPQPSQSPYPPPHPLPPHEHWQHQQQHQQQHPPAQPPPPPQQFNAYARAMPLVPANVEARTAPQGPVDPERANRRQHVVSEILKHCSVLYGFAQHYTQNPSFAPAPSEIEQMNNLAATVVHLLEELRRLDAGEDVPRKDGYAAAVNPPDEHSRPPKRPWEDMARDGEPSPAPGYDTPAHPSPYLDQAQSTAEADMQIIRNKRQSSNGGVAPGQQKNKYRKRSRATPPGKCHSCNIRETPEWRRGPDGARTLCNACGLHYAKLMRKREKTMDGGKAPPIDLQTLRASTASARGSGGSSDHGDSGHPPPHQSQPPPSPYEQPKQPAMHAPPPPQHAGQYQLMSGPGPSGQAHQMMPPHPGSAPHSAGPAAPVPPPPWLTSSGGDRAGYNAEPQSYVRASHPASHARASPQ